MKKVIHRANERGGADYGWLKTNYSFSFASYFNPAKMGFGLLRVINDDQIAGGRGFPKHSHDNMEIVTIPLSGALKHKDSEGHEEVIRAGDLQLMSAGSGVAHSEYNASSDQELRLFQIWVLPLKKDIAPRYDQKTFNSELWKDRFQLVVSPLESDLEGIKINQRAYFSLVTLSAEKEISYKKYEKNNGIYLLVIDGEIHVIDEELSARDAIGITEQEEIKLSAKQASEVLVIEVPMSE